MSSAPLSSLLTRRQWLTLGAAVAGGAAIPWVLRQTLPIGQDVGDRPIAQAVLADTGVPTIGPADGDVTIAVFTDYRCAACRIAHPALMAALEADGRARLRVFEWPVFGAISRRAAQVALAADRQGIYAQVHDRLMTDLRPLDDGVLADVVGAAGGDWARIESDLAQHGETIDARLARTAEQATLLGIPGTPAYLIGPTLVIGALNQAEFAGAFRKARQR